MTHTKKVYTVEDFHRAAYAATETTTRGFLNSSGEVEITHSGGLGEKPLDVLVQAAARFCSSHCGTLFAVWSSAVLGWLKTCAPGDHTSVLFGIEELCVCGTRGVLESYTDNAKVSRWQFRKIYRLDMTVSDEKKLPSVTLCLYEVER